MANSSDRTANDARFQPAGCSPATPPRRRGLRFSLRTLFVVVLALSIPLAWLGVQLKWIHNRHQALEHHDALIVFWAPGESNPEAPWSIRIFGEKGQFAIALRDDKSQAERMRV